jgi:uncharacterized protein YeaO (DUF488 family)
MTRIPASHVHLKRVYDTPAASDGKRVLVDRLWPRGLTKEEAAIDDWEKELAPSNELRKWFGHEVERWAEFQKRYHAELRQNADRIEELRGEARHATLTLLFAAHDEVHNNAVVLRDVLLGKTSV